MKFTIDDQTLQIESDIFNFTVKDPYLKSLNDWRYFLKEVKSYCIFPIELGLLHYVYCNGDFIDLCFDHEEYGYLSVKLSWKEFCNSLEDFINSEQFMEIYNEEE